MEMVYQKPKQLPRRAKGFKIEAELKLAPGDKGVGVFATQFIPANTQVDDYRYIYLDEKETLEILASLQSDEERAFWLSHAFGKDGMIAAHDARVDDGGFINHSDYPTLIDIDGHDYTTRDVYEGEELTENYSTFEEVVFFEKLSDQYSAIDWFIGNDQMNNNHDSRIFDETSLPSN